MLDGFFKLWYYYTQEFIHISEGHRGLHYEKKKKKKNKKTI